jgi:hypothetical protein
VDAAGRLLLVAAFASAKAYALAGRRPVHSGDLAWWDQIGRLPLSDARFWVAERPFTVPLLHKVAGFSEPRVILLQALLDVVAWVSLAQVFSRLVRPLGARLVAFGAVLALALTSGVQGWNLVMRSESASTSFLVLTLAATLGAVRGWSRVRTGAAERPREERRARRSTLAWALLAFASALLAAFARDNNAYALPLVALFAPLGVLLASGRGPRVVRRELFAALGLSASLLVIAGASRANAAAAVRYEWPLMNVVFQRVLTSHTNTRYFEQELGMPLSPALLGRRHRFMSADGWYAARAPELASFRDWLLTRGYAGYQRYLLTHLASTGKAAFGNFVAVAGDSEERHTHQAGNPISSFFDGLLVEPLADYPRLGCIILAALGIFGLFARLAELRLLSGFGLLCLSVALTQAYVCYHADALEVARHSINVGLFLRLSGVTALSALGWLAGSAIAVARHSSSAG